MERKIKNYGFNPELELKHQSPNDWLVGAEPKQPLFEIPNGEVRKYLPVGELQNIGEEKMDCVSRAVVNRCEALLTYGVQNKKFSPVTIQWLQSKGYADEKGTVTLSDAWVAIKSGTTRQGNSLIAPCDVAQNFGMIPKFMLPQLSTFDEYHNPKRLTPEMDELAMDFKSRITINYSRANKSQFAAWCEKGGVVVAGFAWPVPFNGEYPRTDLSPNHSFWLFELPRYYAFDNYLDTDGDFIKKLASDYDFLDVGYRLFVSEENVPEMELEIKMRKQRWWCFDLCYQFYLFIKDILTLKDYEK